MLFLSLLLVGNNDITLFKFGLFPFAENVADDEVLALDFLTQTNAAYELASLAGVSVAADAQLKHGKGTREIFALELLDGFIGELDDDIHEVVVCVDDLTLVAVGDGSDRGTAAL